MPSPIGAKPQVSGHLLFAPLPPTYLLSQQRQHTPTRTSGLIRFLVVLVSLSLPFNVFAVVSRRWQWRLHLSLLSSCMCGVVAVYRCATPVLPHSARSVCTRFDVTSTPPTRIPLSTPPLALTPSTQHPPTHMHGTSVWDSSEARCIRRGLCE